MSDMMMLSTGLAVLDALLAAGLLLVYLRNHREVRSPFTLGLALFAAFVVVYDVTQLYHYWSMAAMFPMVDERMVLLEGALQTGALGALLGATLR
ncbi:MAG: hypothetical protein LC624_00800 [Halobacteriales archaeon]|nr:hypothetical protein [Halobacteriales archaeon]